MFFGINVHHTIIAIGSPCYLIPFFSNVIIHLEKGKKGTRFPCLMNEFYSGILPYEHINNAKAELEQIENELKGTPVSRYIYDFVEPTKPRPQELKVNNQANNLADFIINDDGIRIVDKIYKAFKSALYYKENIWIGDAVMGKDNTPKPYSQENTSHFVFVENNKAVVLDRYFGTENKVTIPQYHNGLKVTAIADKAFAYNEKLLEVNLPNTIKIIGDESFNSCYNLEKVSISDSVETIGKKAFGYCFKLEKISLPQELKIISEQMFDSCTSLCEVLIPQGVQTIETEAFNDCNLLTKITIPSSVAEISTTAFKKTKKHLTIIAQAESAAAKYAKKYKITWEQIPDNT